MKKLKVLGSYLLVLLLLFTATVFFGGCEKGSSSNNTDVTQNKDTDQDSANKQDDQDDANDVDPDDANKKDQDGKDEDKIDEEGSYTSKDEVALYLHEYNKLPSNFITKNEAKQLGWDNKKGNLWDVAEGKSIGGDKFGNREGLLPSAQGRQWYECDIDYQGGFRNEKRIVYSNDGLIYYTGNHYKNFEQLY